MSAQEFIPIPIASAILGAIVGGLVVHLLTAHRDRVNSKRAKKTDFLIQAYMRLESCAHSESSNNGDVMENGLASAIADIQLFGSPLQIKLAQTFAREFAGTGSSNYDALLEDLRSDLRKELNLQKVPAGILHLRFSRK